MNTAARLAVALALGAAVGAFAFADGGYFATSWSWVSLPALWIVIGVLAFADAPRLSRAEMGAVGGLVALLGWTLMSAAWSATPGEAFTEAERTLIYVGVFTVVLVALARRHVPLVLGAMLTATVIACGYGLLSRLLPGELRPYDPRGSQLDVPIGYSDAVGVLAVFGIVLALGFSRSRGVAVRVAAAAALVVLLPVVYFSFGRASWLALACGLPVAVAFAGDRAAVVTDWCLLGVWPALAVALSVPETALTHQGATLAAASAAGHRLAAELALVAVAAAASAAVTRRIGLRAPRRVLAIVALGACSVGVVAFVVHFGAPWTVLAHARDRFSAPPPVTHGNFNQRLFTVSGNLREQYWPVAWRAFRNDPLLGVGAGGFESWWLRYRSHLTYVRDAHNLYLETLAELGVIGLLLLLAPFAIALAAARRVRGDPLTASCAGVVAAYLVHASLQWDWELPALTLVAFVCCAGLLRGAPETHIHSLRPTVRALAGSGVVALAAFAAMGLIGSGALGRAIVATDSGEWTVARANAQKALTWMPWSTDARVWLGTAQLRLGDSAGAATTFRAAADWSPGDWRAWWGLAQTGDASALEQARRLDPLEPQLRR